MKIVASPHLSDSIVRPVILGRFGPPTLACIRSWGIQGFPVGMVCVKSRKEPSPSSKYLTDFATLPPEKLYTPDGIQIIKEFLIRFRATGITCVAESVACWLNDHRQMFPDELAIWLPTNKIIKELVSKEKQIEIARKVGFNVLPTYLIDMNSKASDHIPKDHFPLCLRPDDPATVEPVFKVHLIYSYGELRQYIQSLKNIDRPVIAQPFMNLPNLVVHGARTITGDTIGLQAFLAERKFEGLALTVRPVNLNKELENKCIEFTNYFNISGCYHFDLIREKHTDSVYFLEVNARLGGTTAKVFALGYDEPLLALQAYGAVPIVNKLNTSIHKQETSNQYPATSNQPPASRNQQPATTFHRPLTNVTVSSKQALLKYFYYIIKGRLTPLDYPSEPNLIRLAKTIYGFIRYRDDVFMLRDLKGSMALYFGNLRSKVPI